MKEHFKQHHPNRRRSIYSVIATSIDVRADDVNVRFPQELLELWKRDEVGRRQEPAEDGELPSPWQQKAAEVWGITLNTHRHLIDREILAETPSATSTPRPLVTQGTPGDSLAEATTTPRDPVAIHAGPSDTPPRILMGLDATECLADPETWLTLGFEAVKAAAGDALCDWMKKFAGKWGEEGTRELVRSVIFRLDSDLREEFGYDGLHEMIHSSAYETHIPFVAAQPITGDGSHWRSVYPIRFKETANGTALTRVYGNIEEYIRLFPPAPVPTPPPHPLAVQGMANGTFGTVREDPNVLITVMGKEMTIQARVYASAFINNPEITWFVHRGFQGGTSLPPSCISYYASDGEPIQKYLHLAMLTDRLLTTWVEAASAATEEDVNRIRWPDDLGDQITLYDAFSLTGLRKAKKALVYGGLVRLMTDLHVRFYDMDPGSLGAAPLTIINAQDRLLLENIYAATVRPDPSGPFAFHMMRREVPDEVTHPIREQRAMRKGLKRKEGELTGLVRARQLEKVNIQQIHRRPSEGQEDPCETRAPTLQLHPMPKLKREDWLRRRDADDNASDDAVEDDVGEHATDADGDAADDDMRDQAADDDAGNDDADDYLGTADVALHDDEAVPGDEVPEESDEVGTRESATAGMMRPIEMETGDDPGMGECVDLRIVMTTDEAGRVNQELPETGDQWLMVIPTSYPQYGPDVPAIEMEIDPELTVDCIIEAGDEANWFQDLPQPLECVPLRDGKAVFTPQYLPVLQRIRSVITLRNVKTGWKMAQSRGAVYNDLNIERGRTKPQEARLHKITLKLTQMVLKTDIDYRKLDMRPCNENSEIRKRMRRRFEVFKSDGKTPAEIAQEEKEIAWLEDIIPFKMQSREGKQELPYLIDMLEEVRRRRVDLRKGLQQTADTATPRENRTHGYPLDTQEAPGDTSYVCPTGEETQKPERSKGLVIQHSQKEPDQPSETSQKVEEEKVPETEENNSGQQQTLEPRQGPLLSEQPETIALIEQLQLSDTSVTFTGTETVPGDAEQKLVSPAQRLHISGFAGDAGERHLLESQGPPVYHGPPCDTCPEDALPPVLEVPHLRDYCEASWGDAIRQKEELEQLENYFERIEAWAATKPPETVTDRKKELYGNYEARINDLRNAIEDGREEDVGYWRNASNLGAPHIDRAASNDPKGLREEWNKLEKYRKKLLSKHKDYLVSHRLISDAVYERIVEIRDYLGKPLRKADRRMSVLSETGVEAIGKAVKDAEQKSHQLKDIIDQLGNSMDYSNADQVETLHQKQKEAEHHHIYQLLLNVENSRRLVIMKRSGETLDPLHCAKPSMMFRKHVENQKGTGRRWLLKEKQQLSCILRRNETLKGHYIDFVEEFLGLETDEAKQRIREIDVELEQIETKERKREKSEKQRREEQREAFKTYALDESLSLGAVKIANVENKEGVGRERKELMRIIDRISQRLERKTHHVEYAALIYRKDQSVARLRRLWLAMSLAERREIKGHTFIGTEFDEEDETIAPVTPDSATVAGKITPQDTREASRETTAPLGHSKAEKQEPEGGRSESQEQLRAMILTPPAREVVPEDIEAETIQLAVRRIVNNIRTIKQPKEPQTLDPTWDEIARECKGLERFLKEQRDTIPRRGDEDITRVVREETRCTKERIDYLRRKMKNHEYHQLKQEFPFPARIASVPLTIDVLNLAELRDEQNRLKTVKDFAAMKEKDSGIDCVLQYARRQIGEATQRLEDVEGQIERLLKGQVHRPHTQELSGNWKAISIAESDPEEIDELQEEKVQLEHLLQHLEADLKKEKVNVYPLRKSSAADEIAKVKRRVKQVSNKIHEWQVKLRKEDEFVRRWKPTCIPTERGKLPCFLQQQLIPQPKVGDTKGLVQLVAGLDAQEIELNAYLRSKRRDRRIEELIKEEKKGLEKRRIRAVQKIQETFRKEKNCELTYEDIRKEGKELPSLRVHLQPTIRSSQLEEYLRKTPPFARIPAERQLITEQEKDPFHPRTSLRNVPAESEVGRAKRGRWAPMRLLDSSTTSTSTASTKSSQSSATQRATRHGRTPPTPATPRPTKRKATPQTTTQKLKKNRKK